MLNGLDLFSGIGGISLALAPWVRPVVYCERERYAQAVLLARFADGSLPSAPIWDDVRTLRGAYLPAPVDIIYGGFPCQDISTAGLGAGLEGKRSGLFWEIVLFDIPMYMAHAGLGELLHEAAPKMKSCLFVNRRWTAAKLMVTDVVILHVRTKEPMTAERLIALAGMAGPLDETVKRKIRLKAAERSRERKAA